MIRVHFTPQLKDWTIIVGVDQNRKYGYRKVTPELGQCLVDPSSIRDSIESIPHPNKACGLELFPQITHELKMMRIDASLIDKIVSTLPNLRILRFWLVVMEVSALDLLRKMTGLEILEFSNVTYVQDSKALKTAKELKTCVQGRFEDLLEVQQLVELRLHFSKFIPTFSSTSLLSLELSVSSDVSDLHVQLWRMAKNCPNLQSLSLKFRKKISNFSEVTRFLPQLRSLTLFRVGIKGTDLTASLRNLRKLEKLTIQYCSDLKTFDPTALCGLLQLKTLRVGPSWKDFGDEHLLFALSGGRMEILDLRGVSVTDEGLKCLITLSQLKSLSIISGKITQDGLNFVMQQLEGFETRKKFTEQISDLFCPGTVPLCRDPEKERSYRETIRKIPSQQVLLKSRHLFSLAEG